MDIIAKWFLGIVVVEIIWFAAWYVYYRRNNHAQDKEYWKSLVKRRVEEIEGEK